MSDHGKSLSVYAVAQTRAPASSREGWSPALRPVMEGVTEGDSVLISDGDDMRLAEILVLAASGKFSEIESERMTAMWTVREIEAAAKAIWDKRPDVQGRPWPLETDKDRRAYPHNPVAACDLSFEYARAALDAAYVVRSEILNKLRLEAIRLACNKMNESDSK